MATLVDLESIKEDTPPEGFDALDTDAQAPEEPQVQENRPEEEELPEKYRGKSAAELAKMHQNLEQLMGKQSQEVGELRSAFDSFVQQSMEQRQSAPEPEDSFDESEFFVKPKESVERLIANNPVLKQAQEVAAELAKQQAAAALKASHPDALDIVKQEDFQNWVAGSKWRQDLYVQADKQYNAEAAKELFDLWKERKQVVAQTEAVERVAKQQEVKKASTGTARSNPDGQMSRKIYRRRDIIDLMQRDPKRYEALQPDIMLAYAEGRVR
jgi:hypothetical protein